MSLFRFFYDLVLHLYACTRLCKIGRDYWKNANRVAQLFGYGFPPIEKKEKSLVWIHAVSVGEVKAVAPLIERLRALPTPPLILLSTITETGYAVGAQQLPVDYHVYLPFDISYIIRPIVRKVAPDLVILVETDFWYNFQDAAKKQGAQLLLVNGKVSARSFHRLAKIPFFCRRLFDSFDHLYVQGEIYYKRFSCLQIPREKMTTTGNLKFEHTPPRQEIESLKDRLHIGPGDLICTLGSTHDPEEEIWMEALIELWCSFPALKVFLVPRHPTRCDRVAKQLDKMHIAYTRWSKLGTFQEAPIVLVDEIGVLFLCYQLSTLAFVGGSLTQRVGGHNILEPIFYRVPVLFGPYMHAQPDLVSLVGRYRAGIEITAETLISAVQALLVDQSRYLELVRNGENLVKSLQGIADKIFSSIPILLQKKCT